MVSMATTDDPRRPGPARPAPPEAPRSEALPDLDKLVQEAFDRIGNKGTQSYDSFVDSLPAAHDPDSDSDDPLELGQGARSMFAPSAETAEERIRREYEATEDPELDQEHDTTQKANEESIKVEEIDEDGVVVQELSRASSSFILDGPGNLQFNNFCIGSDDDECNEGDDDEPGYIPSSLSTSPRAKAKPSDMKTTEAVQSGHQSIKEAPGIVDCNVLYRPSIHHSLHLNDRATAEASECATSKKPQEMLDGIIMSASLPDNIPGAPDVTDRDATTSAMLPDGGIFTDADAYIQQNLPDMTSSAQTAVILGIDGQTEVLNSEAHLQEPGASVSKASECSAPHNSSCSADSEDAIEPFKLDEDFDYDNCKLTPKPWPWNPRAPRPDHD